MSSIKIYKHHTKNTVIITVGRWWLFRKKFRFNLNKGNDTAELDKIISSLQKARQSLKKRDAVKGITPKK